LDSPNPTELGIQLGPRTYRVGGAGLIPFPVPWVSSGRLSDASRKPSTTTTKPSTMPPTMRLVPLSSNSLGSTRIAMSACVQ
jgi:hypothetical protein